MHHALLKVINEGGSLGGGAIVVQGTCECRSKGRAEKTGLVNSHLLPVMMTLVIVPHWVWSEEDLAVFHGKTMKARFARKGAKRSCRLFGCAGTTIRSRSAAEIVLLVTKSSSTAFA